MWNKKIIHSKRCVFYAQFTPIENVQMSVSRKNDEIDDSGCEFFNRQIIENLPQNATEILRVVKTYEIWDFYEKCFFFEQNSI